MGGNDKERDDEGGEEGMTRDDRDGKGGDGIGRERLFEDVRCAMYEYQNKM